MERMGDILARTAIRRARQTRQPDGDAPAADTIPAEPAAPARPTPSARPTRSPAPRSVSPAPAGGPPVPRGQASPQPPRTARPGTRGTTRPLLSRAASAPRSTPRHPAATTPTDPAASGDPTPSRPPLAASRTPSQTTAEPNPATNSARLGAASAPSRAAAWPARDASATPPSIAQPAPRRPDYPDLLETPPGMAVPPAVGRRAAPADVGIDDPTGDRILELPARYTPTTRRGSASSSVPGPVARATDPAPSRLAPTPSSPRASMGDDPVVRSPLTPPDAWGEARGNQPTHSARSQQHAAAGDSSVPSSRRGADAEGDPSGPPPRRTGEGRGEEDPCPICGGAGFVRLDVPVSDPAFGKPVPCECKERQIEARRRSDLRRLSSLDPFLDKTFDTFDPNLQGLREAYEAARAFAADPDGWLVLSGPHGVGKTHLAAAVANYQLAQGTLVFFSIVPDLLDHLRAAFAPTSEVPYDEMFDKVREAGLLVLDDLGAENSTAWATEKLFQLINYRYNFRMPTVITTNNRLLSQMDERIRSRLADISLSRHCSIKAQDFRERHVDRSRRSGGYGGGSRGR